MPLRETTRPVSGPSPAELLAELFQVHRQGLAGAVRGVLGRGADVADVLQEAFAKAWPAWHRDPPRDPVAWIFVLTLNTARDARRRRRARRERPLDERAAEEATMELQAKAAEAPPVAAERKEALAAAHSAIESLAEPEKEVFLLRVSGGLTFEAAAEAIGIPVGTAKTRMRSALKRLRASLRGIVPGSEEWR